MTKGHLRPIIRFFRDLPSKPWTGAEVEVKANIKGLGGLNLNLDLDLYSEREIP